MQRRILVDEETGCWVWTGAKFCRGHGQIQGGSKVDGTRRLLYVHRVVWELLVGPIMHQLHHECEHKLCCNPEHLLDITAADHTRIHNATKYPALALDPG